MLKEKGNKKVNQSMNRKPFKLQVVKQYITSTTAKLAIIYLQNNTTTPYLKLDQLIQLI